VALEVKGKIKGAFSQFAAQRRQRFDAARAIENQYVVDLVMMVDQLAPAGFDQPTEVDAGVSGLDLSGKTEPTHKVSKGAHQNDEQRFVAV
jgi:hypothetical protein